MPSPVERAKESCPSFVAICRCVQLSIVQLGVPFLPKRWTEPREVKRGRKNKFPDAVAFCVGVKFAGNRKDPLRTISLFVSLSVGRPPSLGE